MVFIEGMAETMIAFQKKKWQSIEVMAETMIEFVSTVEGFYHLILRYLANAAKHKNKLITLSPKLSVSASEFILVL